MPDHLPLLTRWLAALAPGGTLALQVPANLDAPSHALMRDAAQRHTRADELRPALDRSLAVAAPETYAALLLAEGAVVDVWQTTYQHVLPLLPGRRHPVLEWVRGTGLRPVLGVLTDPDEREEFLVRLRAGARAGLPPAALRRALPVHPHLRRRPAAVAGAEGTRAV